MICPSCRQETGPAIEHAQNYCARGLRWRIYTRLNTTIHSGQSTWEQAVATDIVAIVWQFNDGPVRVELGTPYYLHAGDWIARIWDPTLYLRQFGVKFGRWAKNEEFDEAWRHCLEVVGAKPVPTDHASLAGSTVCATREQTTEPVFGWGIWYDNHQRLLGTDLTTWNQAPTDGVLAVCYHHVLNSVVLAFGLRRYTFFYWRYGELLNTDDLDEVLKDFPQFKRGCPSFMGKSYLDQGLAIAAALSDTLEDVP
jgi:hypothetical protein